MFKFLFFFIYSNFFLFALSLEEKTIKRSLYPYTIKGITYYPKTVPVGKTKEVFASWYGEYFHGRKTAMGNIYDMYGYSAAHKTFPLGTMLLVTNPKNGKSLEVKVDDRGPFWNDRGLDLSMGAAEYLGTKREGVAKVKYEVLSVPDIVNSLEPLKKTILPLAPIYNSGYTAVSYTSIMKSTKKVPIEIGTFFNKKEAKLYLTKIKKHLPNAYIFKEYKKYKIKFFLSSNENLVTKKLKDLKKRGLITGYGLCWSYNN
ncbi:MAG: Rare lipoprotein A precursor [uncultured Sulfurovum sp.]|uniref:Probable endolytic peptidoglycan transglycosylase RlpA n=1 Tax=uncultured Sulfurovum sp. TaxID=269237 RepID=A0A6S6U9E6_9BACT|nr:MAG: Rare lipoprotein A precursor [uncultured Sulfurovum sp.]